LKFILPGKLNDVKYDKTHHYSTPIYMILICLS